MGELMRESTDPSSNSISSLQAIKEVNEKKTNDTAHLMNGFSHNIGELLLRIYYSKFRDWYSHMVIPQALRTDSSKQWLMNFSFVNQNTTKEITNVRGSDNAN